MPLTNGEQVSSQQDGKLLRATMEDIARVCGFSKMTVSRALADRPGVSLEARRKVQAAAKKLNYEINAMAQNLNSNRSGFIGVATSWEGLIGSNYFAEIFRGFKHATRNSGIDFALFDTLDDSFNDGNKLARLYRQRKVDGLLVVAPHSNDRFLKTLGSLHVPLVVVGESPSDPSVCWISCDNTDGIKSVCRHLIALRHRRIAFIGGPQDLASAERRRGAFLDFCRQAKIEVPPDYLQTGDYTMHSGRVAALDLLKLPQPPTAILAANDLMAFGAIESARELGINVPAELSVAGFDDLPTAAERCPSLTTVHQPVFEMAERSARVLLEALENSEIPSGHIKMKVELVVRESTGACP